MKIIFRLNYHTVQGQALWLKYSLVLGGVRIDQSAPLKWLNEGQWQVELKFRGAGRFRIEYNYQLRQEATGVVRDEWQPVRSAEADLDNQDVLLLLDTWCSAGTVDYAFETYAFRVIHPGKSVYSEAPKPPNANHCFQLRMAALPPGKVPCLMGGIRELGGWGWHSAVPLQETAPNVWEANLYLPTDWEIEYKYALFDAALRCVTSVELGENRRLPSRTQAVRQWVQVTDECFRRPTAGLFRGAGVAIPVFSLRSADGLGVGEFADLKPLAKWAHGVGLKMIQILPINDTTSSLDWTDSYPYSAISVFALHPLYLRIDALDYAMPAEFKRELADAKTKLNASDTVDYEKVIKTKLVFAKRIFEKHRSAITKSALYLDFLTENSDWVVPYAVFRVKRDLYGTADFSQWRQWASYEDKAVRSCAEEGHAEWADVAFHIWLQAELDKQLADATAFLHAQGIALKGDLPIGIDRQSVEAWSAPHLFKMDAQAGAPPDAFAVKGQNWGFPTYNWEAMQLDDYAWWRSRFAKLSRYFDAYRIDHILGFFRIWQVPYDQVEGIMGYFDPAMPIHIDEIRSRGIAFDHNRFCKPYIRDSHLTEIFGDASGWVKDNYLHDCGHGFFQLRDEVSTQRKIAKLFADDAKNDAVKVGLMDCVSNVLFFEVPGSQGTLFHPRCSLQATTSFKDLDPFNRWRIEELYNDYFYKRQENFWEGEAYKKLPAMRQASSMLLCGEDLGMVPARVPGVLKELGILSLEIQRMPKIPGIEFADPGHVPYMSVVSPSTHDMPTLREWWKEDPGLTARFARQMFGINSPASDLSGEVAMKIIWQHLELPAMWAIFPLQELLAMDEKIRNPDLHAERINVPAIMPFYWRYRMHIPLTDLAAAVEFNTTLQNMISGSGR